MTEWVTVSGHGSFRLHWNSWLARALKPIGNINNCVTLTRYDIYVTRSWISSHGFSHEVGHTLQAKRYGWTYLPRILWAFLTHGYERSPMELEADQYRVDHAAEFPALVNKSAS